MSSVRSKAALMLVTIAMAAGCSDEPLSPAEGGQPGSGDAATVEAQAAVKGSPRARAEVQAIVTTFDEAWTSGDYATYAAQYAGAEWIGPDGRIVTDPAILTEIYRTVITLVFPGTTRLSTIRNLTFLTGTIAIVDIDTRVTGPLPPFIVPWQPGVVRALEKNVLIKRGGEWRIVQHQQVIVAPGVQ